MTFGYFHLVSWSQETINTVKLHIIPLSEENNVSIVYQLSTALLCSVNAITMYLVKSDKVGYHFYVNPLQHEHPKMQSQECRISLSCGGYHIKIVVGNCSFLNTILLFTIRWFQNIDEMELAVNRPNWKFSKFKTDNLMILMLTITFPKSNSMNVWPNFVLTYWFHEIR